MPFIVKDIINQTRTSTFDMSYLVMFQSVRFTFDGQRVNAADTAAGLGMEEGDTIEVFQEQQGGQVGLMMVIF